MAHAISLFLALFATWLLLSGMWVPLILGLGALSCVAIYFIVARMELVDHEAHPINLRLGKLLTYVPWLLWQIVRANIDVVKLVLNPQLPISPTVIRLKSMQHTTLGRVIFANSITLTPGTVTIDVSGTDIEVHALTRDTAMELQNGEMNRRVAKLEYRDTSRGSGTH